MRDFLFVIRRSGVQIPHPAPVISIVCEVLGFCNMALEPDIDRTFGLVGSLPTISGKCRYNATDGFSTSSPCLTHASNETRSQT